MRKKLNFLKMEGTGNDFILIDEEKITINKIKKITPFLCHRKKGIGADGVLIPLKHKNYDFKMIYFNADGSRAEFCANGARCLAFYMSKRLKRKKLKFIADDGVHEAEIIDFKKGIVKLKLKNPKFEGEYNIPEIKRNLCLINSGVPHLIEETEEIEKINVKERGRFLRFYKKFQPSGTNVDFIKIKNDKIYIRTYERGVEDEVLSCGTGAVAAAYYARMKKQGNTYKIITRGNEILEVEFNKNHVFLTGPVKIVFKGTIELNNDFISIS